MRLFKILLVMVVSMVGLAFGLEPAPSRAAQEVSRTAPYIYYESRLQNGIIVERADGTDSHRLGGITMPLDHVVGKTPVFSFDYQWVAWTSRGDSGGDAQLYITRVDGTARVETMSGINRVIDILWSPVHNHIAVLRTTRAGNSTGAAREYEILLLDAEFGDIITRRVQVALAIRSMAWSGDGTTLSVFYGLDPDDDYYTPRVYKRLDMTLSNDFSRTDVTPTACEQPNYVFSNSTLTTFVDLPNRQLSVTHMGDSVPTTLDLPPGYFQSLQWSHDHQQFVVWVRDDCSEEGRASHHLWHHRMGSDGFTDVATNIALDTMFAEDLWSKDGQSAAFAQFAGSVLIVNFAQAEPSIITVPLPPDFDASLAAFDWMPDGTLYLQMKNFAKDYYQWTLGDTEFVRFGETLRFIQTVFFSPDGRYLTYGGDCPAAQNIYGAACIVDTQDNNAMHVIYPHGGSGLYGYSFKEVRWHPVFSNWMFVINGGGAGGGEQFIQVANIEGTVRRELTSCGYQGCYGWLPDQVQVATIPPIDTPPSIPAMTLIGMQDYVLQGAWNPAGTQIAVSTVNGSLLLFDATNGELLNTLPGHTFDWSPDGTRLATIDRTVADDERIYWTLDGEGPLVLVDTATGEAVQTIDGLYFTVDYSPDGNYLAAGSGNGEVWIFDAATGETLYTLRFPTLTAAVAFSPDSQRLAIGGATNEIWVWDYASDADPQAFGFNNRTVYLSGIFALTWHPDGTAILGGGGPGMFFFGNNSILFDLTSGVTTVLPEASYATFSDDGSRHAFVDEYNGTLAVVDNTNGEKLLEVYRAGWWIDFSPDGSHLLLAEAFTVSVWSLP